MEDLDVLIPKGITINIGKRTAEVPPLSIKRYVGFMRIFNQYVEEIVKGENISEYISDGAVIATKAIAVAIGEDEEKLMDEIYPIQAVEAIQKIMKANGIEKTLKNTIAMVVPEGMSPSQKHLNSSRTNMGGRSKKLKK